ncbi:Reverse transcriptase [Theobroma cacao]|nr:Reverse transcriptase [Theobroma cacao]
MSRRNRRLTRRGFRKDQGASWKIRNKNDSNKKEEMICYECKKPSHFKSECPLLKDETPKKNKRSKKSMVAAAWSESDTSSFETDDEKSEERANIYLIAQEDETKVELDLKETCSRAQLRKKQPWYLDSGCSRHMTGHEELFAQLEKRNGGTVFFGDDSKGRIHGIGTVDDIVFGATNETLCNNFAKEMQGEFEMSMMGELKYFLGLQIKQSEEGIFINQERYTHDMLKKFYMLKLKSISTPMSTSTKLDIDEKGKDVDRKLYRDADFAVSRIDRKSTSETCQFLGRMLVSWSSKKQNSVALSTVEAEYVSLSSCCAQILWIKQQLKDYGIIVHNTSLSEYFDELKLKGYNTFKNRSYSPSLVKEFYSGIAPKEKELVESDDYVEDGLDVYLNGKEFIVTVGDLENLLKLGGEVGEFELPENYDPFSLWEIITRRKEKYSSKSNSSLIINPQIRILHYFIAANIQGRSGSLSYISLQDLWLMEHAFNGVYQIWGDL